MPPTVVRDGLPGYGQAATSSDSPTHEPEPAEGQ